MAVNYNDERFTEVKNQEATAIRETEGKYDNMINQTDSFYDKQINVSKEWADKQSEIQQAQTDFTIEKIEQTKDKAHKDYIKEQKGAYSDYQKAIDPYGVNAEKLAEQGLQNSGYSKSVAINAYNTYQNRYMSARESYNQAILNYDNSIKEAQLANNAQLAQIAYEALQKQLELSLEGFQYKNTLILQKLDAVNEQKDRYYQRYQDVLSQINTENALAEQIRQYNESLAEEKRQYNESLAFQKAQAAQEQANWQKEYNLAVQSRLDNNSGGGDDGDSELEQTKKQDPEKDTSGNSTVTSGSGGAGGGGGRSGSNSSKSTSQDVSIKYNGETYYQSYEAALKAGGYGGYSLTGALQKNYLKTITRNGQVYYAPAKSSSSSSSSSNWRNTPLSSVDRVMSFK